MRISMRPSARPWARSPSCASACAAARPAPSPHTHAPAPPPGLVAASAVKWLAPRCAPLTHLTVAGCLVQVKGTFRAVFDVLALLEDAKVTSAASLTCLRILLRREVHHRTWGVYEETMFSQLLEPASEVLSAFTRLTHLHLPGASLDAQSGMDLLPPLIESLLLRKVSYGPAPTTRLDNLRLLSLEKSTCGVLVQILAAAPTLQQVSLLKLLAPGSEAGLADLHTLQAHPLLALGGSKGGGCSGGDGSGSSSRVGSGSGAVHNAAEGVAGISDCDGGGSSHGTGDGSSAAGSSSRPGCSGSSNGGQGSTSGNNWVLGAVNNRHTAAQTTAYLHNEKCQERELGPCEVLRRLPILASITDCTIDFEPSIDVERPAWADLQTPCLYHLPTAFPNLTRLTLEYLSLPSVEFLGLLACTSLVELSLGYCDRVCGEVAYKLGEDLPRLEEFRIRGCDLVDQDSSECVMEIVGRRASASRLRRRMQHTGAPVHGGPTVSLRSELIHR
ncbi:MAG: hypothetical protein WDW38_006249 [Sanguina aurantia]